MTRLRTILAKSRTARSLRRFQANENGATAVEFALVAPIFFAILFAIMQTSLVMFTNQALQTKTTTAARLIMTGQSTNLEQFKNRICGDSYLFKCDKLRVQVESFDSFSAADPEDFVGSACFNLESTPDEEDCWQPGGPRKVVLVRVAYDWVLGTAVAVSAFQSEPY